MKVISSREELVALSGTSLGASSWLQIDQDRVDLFARATDDHQWIHVDPERAARGPYGATIAHGYLTLSLLPRLTQDVFRLDGVRHALNYGLERVRFLSPVRTGSRIRAEVTLTSVKLIEPDSARLALSTTVLIAGEDKPACVCEGIGLVRFETESEIEPQTGIQSETALGGQ